MDFIHVHRIRGVNKDGFVEHVNISRGLADELMHLRIIQPYSARNYSEDRATVAVHTYEAWRDD